MKTNRSSAAIFSLGLALGAAGIGLLSNGMPVVRADDTRKDRMDESKWTTGDRARDALNHLQKAEAHMSHIADKENSKVAKDAAEKCRDAREKVDQFIEALGDREKRR
jgi:hypothetical protein